MSIISALQTYIKTYTGVSDGPVWVQYLGSLPNEYSVVALPGGGTIKHYLDDTREKAFFFALESTVSTADEAARLENSGFYESFARWLDQQNDAESFPTLETDQIPESIEAQGSGFLIEVSESQTGIYHIVCLLTYTQKP